MLTACSPKLHKAVIVTECGTKRVKAYDERDFMSLVDDEASLLKNVDCRIKKLKLVIHNHE
jgi:hypothetical protein